MTIPGICRQVLVLALATLITATTGVGGILIMDTDMVIPITDMATVMDGDIRIMEMVGVILIMETIGIIHHTDTDIITIIPTTLAEEDHPIQSMTDIAIAILAPTLEEVLLAKLAIVVRPLSIEIIRHLLPILEQEIAVTLIVEAPIVQEAKITLQVLPELIATRAPIVLATTAAEALDIPEEVAQEEVRMAAVAEAEDLLVEVEGDKYFFFQIKQKNNILN